MGRAMDVLVQQSRVVPSLMFRIPESVSQGTSSGSFPGVTESEEPQDDDEDNHDKFLDL